MLCLIELVCIFEKMIFKFGTVYMAVAKKLSAAADRWNKSKVGQVASKAWSKTKSAFRSAYHYFTEEGKLDFEGFLSPLVIERYAQYMHSHRLQSDGKLRESDNWQKGIPLSAYMKSMWRHFFSVWKQYRAKNIQEEDLCALLFNVMGMLHETLKKNGGENG